MVQKILVTGARGFVGEAVCAQLETHGHSIKRAVRHKRTPDDFAVDCSGTTDWTDALSGCDIVIHLAAAVHQMNASSTDQLAIYRRINVDGTRNLATQAAAQGVKRFIYISSIKVNGERTEKGFPFSVESPAAPEDPYGVSKWEAEQILHALSKPRGMDIVIIRPPLVYGPNAKGNMASLVKLLRRGIPLPFGCLDNRRSLIGLSNLADLVVQCIDHPAAAGQTFLASDGEDLSTPELIRHISGALGKSVRLIPVPVVLLKLAGHLTGKSSMVERLTESLQIDISHTRQTLNWTPRNSVKDEMRRMVNSYATHS